MHINIPAWLHAELVKLANEQNRTVASLIREELKKLVA